MNIDPKLSLASRPGRLKYFNRPGFEAKLSLDTYYAKIIPSIIYQGLISITCMQEVERMQQDSLDRL